MMCQFDDLGNIGKLGNPWLTLLDDKAIRDYRKIND